MATTILAKGCRNVKDPSNTSGNYVNYGGATAAGNYNPATGTGTDDTQAFLDAFNLNRGMASNNVNPAAVQVYVPPGNYLVHQQIICWSEFVFFGEPSNPPTITLKANSIVNPPPPDGMNTPGLPLSFICVRGGSWSAPYSTHWNCNSGCDPSGQNACPSGTVPGRSNNNTFHVYIYNINFTVLAGNTAVAAVLEWSTAQNTAIRNVVLTGTSTQTYGLWTRPGINGEAGGGGIIQNVTCNGVGTATMQDSVFERAMRGCTFNGQFIGQGLNVMSLMCCAFNGGLSINGGPLVTLDDCTFASGTQFTNPNGGLQGHLENCTFGSANTNPAIPGTPGLVAQYTSVNVLFNQGSESGASSNLNPNTVVRGTPFYNPPYPSPNATAVSITSFGSGNPWDAALNNAFASGATDVYFPPGQYTFNSTINLGPPKRLFGLLNGSCQILSAASPIISVTGRGVGAIGIIALGIHITIGATGPCMIWNGDQTSVLLDMDVGYVDAGDTTPLINGPLITFASGGGFYENSGPSIHGNSVNHFYDFSSTDPLYLIAIDPQHSALVPMRMTNAQNVIIREMVYEMLVQNGITGGALVMSGCNKMNIGGLVFADRSNGNNAADYGFFLTSSNVSIWPFSMNACRNAMLNDTTHGFTTGSNGNGGFNVVGGYIIPSTVSNGTPTVSATGATVGLNSAVLGGTVISANGPPVTLDGFVWGPENSPQTYPNIIQSTVVQSGNISGTIGGGLTTGSRYHYKATATNSIGQGSSSDTLFIPAPPPPLVQANGTTGANTGTPLSTLNLQFNSPQVSGNRNVVAISFNAGPTITSVTDTQLNTYTAVSPLTTGTGDAQTIYTCSPTKADTTTPNTITVQFSATTQFIGLRILEYHGLGGLDVHSENSGTGALASLLGTVSTTHATDVLLVAVVASTVVNGVDTTSPFTERLNGVPSGGSDVQDYYATALLTPTGATDLSTSSNWVINMVAFAPSGSLTVPSLSVSAATGIGTSIATMNGSITSAGGQSITADGFDWGTTTTYGTHVNVTPAVQIGSFSSNLTVLSPGSTYHYRATAQNASGTGDSGDQMFSTTSVGTTYSLVNHAYVDPNTVTLSTLTLAPSWAQASGDILIVAIGYTSGSATVTVSDTANGVYSKAIGPTVDTPGGQTQYVFYRSNIATANSGTNTITCSFSASGLQFPDMRVSEFSSTLGTTWTVNQSAGLVASSATTDTSGNMPATTVSNALIYGAGYTSAGFTQSGPGFTVIDITSLNGDDNIHEYQVVTSVGAYSATGNDSAGGNVIMQAVAFVASTGNTIPSVGVSAAITGTTTATLNGSITSNGNQNITIEGFNYGLTTNYGIFVVAGTMVQGGAFSSNISGLTANTSYHCQATATNASGAGVSVDQPFTTSGAGGHTPTIIQHFSTATNYNAPNGTGSGPVNPGNPFHISWMHPTIAGNCLIVEVSGNNTTSPVVTDDKGNVYSFVKSASNGTTMTSVFKCLNCIAGAIRLVATFNANTFYAHLSGSEIAFVTAIASSSSLNAGGSATVSAGTLATVAAGSMIWMCGLDTANQGETSTNNLTTYSPGANFELLATETFLGAFSQFSTSISGTNITPTATLNGGNSDVYNAIALVLTAGSQGALPPPGIRILRSQGIFASQQKAIQFPCRGNLVYATSTFSTGLTAWTFPAGWTTIIDSALGAYISGVNNPNFTVNIGGLTNVSSGIHVTSMRMYDIAGAASSPFDKFTPSVTDTFNITTTPQDVSWITITPSTSNGLLIGTLPIGITAISEHSTPTLTINDHCWYGNMWGGDTMENVDGYGHILNSVAGTQYIFDWAAYTSTFPPPNFTFPITNEQIWGIAIAFKTVAFTESPDQTAVTTIGPVITDYNGNTWAITSGGQVSLNGTAIGFTSGVVEIAYAGRVVWQFNGTSWFSFSPNGTVSIGPVATSPLVGSATVSPSVSVSAPTGLSTITVTLNGVITSNGNSNITQDGFKYGVAGGPSGTYGTTVNATTIQSGAISVNLTGITPNSTYHYIVFATNAVGTGQTVDQTFTTLSGPSVPTGFSASTVSTSSISTNWTVPVAQVDLNFTNIQITYPIEHMGGEFPSFTQFGVGTGVVSGADSLLDSGLLHPGTTYSYRMRALDPSNNFSAYTSTFTGATSAADVTVPTVPGTPTLFSETNNSITIVWSTSTDTQESSSSLTYTIQRSTNVGTFTQIATNIPGVASGNITYSDAGLTALNQYSYRVQAVNPANLSGSNSSNFSTASATITTEPNPPFFVQGNTSSASGVTSASCSFNSAQTTGDGNLVVISTSSAAAINISGPVTDQAGNTYALIGGPTSAGSSPVLTQWIYFSNI